MSPMSSHRSVLPQNLAGVCTTSDQMLGKVYPVIPGRLSFTIHRDEEHTKACIKHDRKSYYFSSWMHESYESFVSDFGPVDLSATVQFCEMLREKLNDPRLQRRHLVYYCDADAAFFTNLAYLLGSYLVLVEDWSPDAAAKPFETIDSSMLRPFHDVLHDAKKSPSTFDLTLLDCFRGLQRAVDDGFFKYSEFDVELFELMLDPSVADASVICPQFLAFRGPMSSSYCASGKAVSFRGRTEWAKEPSAYVELFKELGVSSVVRLNGAETYDKEEFRKHGLEHHELFFEDCSVPSHQLVQDFHTMCDAASGRIAVHCMAGLGRTGTMIATWIMRRFGWTAREAIAWLRIVRPGSVMGPQQHFLECYERSLRVQEDATAVHSDCEDLVHPLALAICA